ncbi:putative ankyrin repeat-containing domain-containing protein [Helianthus annuus]|nr:putative ankyrin repeat-containing domain-containing protein [Helianthus annuus]
MGQHSVTGVTPLMVFARKGRDGDICMLLSFGANCHLRDKEGKTALSWAEQADLTIFSLSENMSEVTFTL